MNRPSIRSGEAKAETCGHKKPTVAAEIKANPGSEYEEIDLTSRVRK